MSAPSSQRPFRLGMTSTLMCVGLAGSLLANVVLCWQAVTQYRKRSEQQLDPHGLLSPFPPAQPARNAPAHAPVVLFYGDSRAQQWPAPKLPGCRFENRGIGGQTSAQVLGRFDEHVVPLSPSVVVLQVGINDLKSIAVLRERREQIENTLVHHVRELVERTRAQGSKVILTTLFPLGRVPPWLWPIWSDEVSLANDRVNEELRRLAKNAGVVLLDAFALLADGKQLRPEYGFDTLHLSERGYVALNIELSKRLAAHCAEQAAP